MYLNFFNKDYDADPLPKEKVSEKAPGNQDKKVNIFGT